MCIPGQIHPSCKWLGHSWSQEIHGVRLMPEFGFLCFMGKFISGFFSLGVKIQFTTRMRCIPSQIINKFPVTEAQPHQTELCAALKRKRIKSCYSPNTSWDEHDVYLTSGLNSAGSSLLTEQTDPASPSIWQQHMQFTFHMGSFFRQPSDYKMSQEVTLDPHYWVQTLSIPFCSIVHSFRRGAFIIIFICAALAPAS